MHAQCQQQYKASKNTLQDTLGIVATVSERQLQALCERPNKRTHQAGNQATKLPAWLPSCILTLTWIKEQQGDGRPLSYPKISIQVGSMAGWVARHHQRPSALSLVLSISVIARYPAASCSLRPYDPKLQTLLSKERKSGA